MSKCGRKSNGEDPLIEHTAIHIPTEEKPLAEITLADLLQCSPDVRVLKRGPEHRTSIFDTFRRKTTHGSNIFGLAPSTTGASSLGINLESSKLNMLNSPNYIEPMDKMGKRKLKKLRKDERDKTKGPAWFNMPNAEITEERKNDLEALSLRGALDKKRFYKRNNLPTRPKYFQVGRIIEAPADFYHSRVPKRQRKKTVAEEMVAEISSTVSHL